MKFLVPTDGLADWVVSEDAVRLTGYAMFKLNERQLKCNCGDELSFRTQIRDDRFVIEVTNTQRHLGDLVAYSYSFPIPDGVETVEFTYVFKSELVVPTVKMVTDENGHTMEESTYDMGGGTTMTMTLFK